MKYLVVLVLLLGGCTSLDKRVSAAGCATAVFLGPHIGLPIAIGCALYETDEKKDDLDV